MPVTVTVTLPVAVNVHERVDEPDPPDMEDGLTVHAVLSLVKVTVAVKLFNGLTAIVEVPAEPTTTLTLDGLAAMLKSGAAVIV